MIRKITAYTKSPSFAGFKKLIFGNIAVQIVNLSFYPIITRTFSSEALGAFGVQMNVCYLIAILANGQYYMAAIQEKDDNKIDTSISASLLLTVVFFLISIPINLFLGFSFLLPLLILFYSFTEIMKVRSYREGNFSEASLSIFINRFVAQGGKCIGIFYPTTYLLIASEVLGNLAGGLNYFKRGLKFRLQESLQALKRYKEFPLYVMPNNLIGYLLQEFPTFFFAKQFGFKVAAFFFLYQKVLALPLTLFGSILASSLIKRTVECTTPEESKRFLSSVVIKLLAVSIPPSLIIFFFGEEIFTLFLGSNFTESGKIASLLFFVLPFKVLKGMGAISTLNSNKLSKITLIKFAHLMAILAYIAFADIGNFHNFLIYFSLTEIIFDTINLLIALRK